MSAARGAALLAALLVGATFACAAEEEAASSSYPSTGGAGGRAAGGAGGSSAGGAGGSSAGGQGGPVVDRDGDGLTDVEEATLGTDPASAGDPGAAAVCAVRAACDAPPLARELTIGPEALRLLVPNDGEAGVATLAGAPAGVVALWADEPFVQVAAFAVRRPLGAGEEASSAAASLQASIVAARPGGASVTVLAPGTAAAGPLDGRPAHLGLSLTFDGRVSTPRLRDELLAASIGLPDDAVTGTAASFFGQAQRHQLLLSLHEEGDALLVAGLVFADGIDAPAWQDAFSQGAAVGPASARLATRCRLGGAASFPAEPGAAAWLLSVQAVSATLVDGACRPTPRAYGPDVRRVGDGWHLSPALGASGEVVALRYTATTP